MRVAAASLTALCAALTAFACAAFRAGQVDDAPAPPPPDASALVESGAPAAATADAGSEAEAPADAGPPITAVDSGPLTPFLVQAKGVTLKTTSTLKIQFSKDTKAGNTVVLVVAANDASVQNLPTGWNRLEDSTSHIPLSIFVLPSCPKALAQLSMTWENEQLETAALITEWQGLDPYEATGVANGDTTLATPDDFKPSTRALLFAAASTHKRSFTPPANAFVPIGTSVSDNLTNLEIVAAAFVSPGAGTFSTSWGLSPQSGWDAVDIVFPIK